MQGIPEMRRELPFVSVVVPCRNELGYIDKCLDGLVECDYPRERLEVLVADGMSDDGTRDVLAAYAAKHAFIRVLDNPRRILASAWNVGIRAARGEIIVALNAHGVFNRSYISQCVSHLLSKPELDCVGGVVKAIPKDDTFIGKAICIVLSHPFGVGNSHFRCGSSTPRLADTVAFGGYWRKLFDRVGLFNEELTRSQDMELHRRLEAIGAKILLVPSMYCHYYTRSRFRDFWRYSFLNGFWVTYPLRFAAVALRLRHVIPLCFVVSLLVTGLGSLAAGLPGAWPLPALFLAILGAYAAAALGNAVRVAARERDWRHAAVLPALFATLHITYGVGSLAGLLRAAMTRRFWGSVWNMFTRSAPAAGEATRV